MPRGFPGWYCAGTAQFVAGAQRRQIFFYQLNMPGRETIKSRQKIRTLGLQQQSIVAKIETCEWILGIRMITNGR